MCLQASEEWTCEKAYENHPNGPRGKENENISKDNMLERHCL